MKMSLLGGPFMTSLWRITTGADGNANLLEIDLLRWSPSGKF